MKIKLIALLISVTMLAGCISDPGHSMPRRVDLNLNISNLGTPMIIGTDTLQVDIFKFLVRTFQLTAQDSVIIESTGDLGPMIFSYNEALSLDRLVLSVSIGYDNIDIFESFKIFVDRALPIDNIFDNDFFGVDGETYSIVARGTYNGSPFMFTSAFDFERLFQFDGDVVLSDTEETLVIRVMLDIEDVFMDESRNLLFNPFNPDKRDDIVTSFRDNLFITSFAANMFSI